MVTTQKAKQLNIVQFFPAEEIREDYWAFDSTSTKALSLMNDLDFRSE